MLSRFHLVLERNGQTDRRTDRQICYINIRSAEQWYLSHCRNSVEKNCFLAQNFTEIGQSATELWPKTIFTRM